MTAMPANDARRPPILTRRIRAHLQRIAVKAETITYKALADAVGVAPPNTVHQVTEALEHLILEDAANGHPFIAALVVSRARGGLPAPGFFDCASRAGRFHHDLSGPEAWIFHRAEFDAAVAFWSAAAEPAETDEEPLVRE